MFVHVVGLPPSHQPPGIQRTVCDAEFLHVGPHGLLVPVPERAGPGAVPAPLSVGQVRLLPPPLYSPPDEDISLVKRLKSIKHFTPHLLL